jgi:Tfp pilus assembly protein PilO
MKLPKNYLENLPLAKYREYLKLLPNMKKENTKAITMLIFTFFALSFLGVFAINPTLTTIVELHKQLEESKFVHDRLTEKMNNLSGLQQQYNTINSDLPYVFNAIPQSAGVPKLVGQMQALAEENKVKITSLRISDVQLNEVKKSPQEANSFTFLLQAQGDYENMQSFAADLAHFDRIVDLESVGFTKDTKLEVLILTVKGKQYFKE